MDLPCHQNVLAVACAQTNLTRLLVVCVTHAVVNVGTPPFGVCVTHAAANVRTPPFGVCVCVCIAVILNYCPFCTSQGCIFKSRA